MTHTDPAATLTFTAQEVLPGTPYSDEPGETVAPGWYVIGTYADDPADGPAVVISIDHAIDRDAALIDGAIARHIADLLTDPAHEETMPANADVVRTATSLTVNGKPGARCPSCHEDGGYGDTQSHTEYRCPCCGTDWSWNDTPPYRQPMPVLERLNRWISRRQIRSTSTCSCWRQ